MSAAAAASCPTCSKLHLTTLFIVATLAIAMVLTLTGQAIASNDNDDGGVDETIQQTAIDDNVCFYGIRRGDFCSGYVTWPISVSTYTDVNGSNTVARDFYHYHLDYISSQGEPSEECKEHLRFMACGRAFVRCVDKNAPELQLCRSVCQKTVAICDSPAMTYDDIKSSCRENNRDCHAGTTTSTVVGFGITLTLIAITVVVSAAI